MIKPVIFLDRDGVVTKEKSYVKITEEMEVFGYSRDCVSKIHNLGYLAIVITNQSGVGRGYFGEEELQRMNRALIQQTGVDAVYYCPHWYDEKNDITEYNVVCECRKPKIGMIEKAIADFRNKGIELNMKMSYFIGDRGTDIQTGKNAGIKTVLVESGYGSSTLKGIQPDYIYEDLKAFTDNLQNM